MVQSQYYIETHIFTIHSTDIQNEHHAYKTSMQQHLIVGMHDIVPYWLLVNIGDYKNKCISQYYTFKLYMVIS